MKPGDLVRLVNSSGYLTHWYDCELNIVSHAVFRPLNTAIVVKVSTLDGWTMILFEDTLGMIKSDCLEVIK